MKKGQMKLSFGMIFSIILIVVFLVFAFMGIKRILDLQDHATNLKFLEDIEEDVNKIYLGSKASITRTYTLPKDVMSICFSDSEYGNLEIYSSEGNGLPNREDISKIDIDRTLTVLDEDRCFRTENRKVSLLLTKDYQQDLVTIKRPSN